MAKDTQALPVNPDRAAIEAERGITRNEAGEIVLTKAQKKEKIAYFKRKIEDFDTRKANALARIKELEA